MKKELLIIGIAIILIGMGLGGCLKASQGLVSRDQNIADMIDQVDEKNIYSTIYDLQNFTSRHYGTPGNEEAATYLYDKLTNISGLKVEYQQGDFRNVIATLPGKDTSSTDVYIVGAHYDSASDEGNAPGATDNGGGVAIVLELARVMSQHEFNHTIKFAFWNQEEGPSDTGGSGAYVVDAMKNESRISLYMNFDSSCYDPNHRLILDIMYNDQSSWVSDMMTQHNSLYDIGFKLTYNVHKCGSDHLSFRNNGYTTIMTHEEIHGPAHSSEDTIDKVSTEYAKKNAQLGMSVIAKLAEPV